VEVYVEGTSSSGDVLQKKRKRPRRHKKRPHTLSDESTNSNLETRRSTGDESKHRGKKKVPNKRKRKRNSVGVGKESETQVLEGEKEKKRMLKLEAFEREAIRGGTEKVEGSITKNDAGSSIEPSYSRLPHINSLPLPSSSPPTGTSFTFCCASQPSEIKVLVCFFYFSFFIFYPFQTERLQLQHSDFAHSSTS
jgi:hypothetical protein